ncbi:MAG: diguanylate phosphodiesterase metal dependent hydrolase domain containing protein [Paenibacillaceae bacterium]|jgi:EAL and modified HD-GYP domain-containing signal transduction protein|nr:diguanylate phosphodiesterase metal dependent hydrolase domain containing protein [Paenibacillaceae bacterium]
MVLLIFQYGGFYGMIYGNGRKQGCCMPLLFARQPIIDRIDRIYGYELLYREEESKLYQSKDGDMATSQVMAASFLSMGFEAISGNKKAWINFTSTMLLQKTATLFPRDKLVVEILESVEPTEAVVKACRNLKDSGYTIALDDFVFKPGYEALIELADIIKVDFRLTSGNAERMGIVKRYGNGKIRFLAEKVETREEHQTAFNMGYSLFQGYYYCKPVLVHTQGIPPSTISHLQLIKVLEKQEPDFDELVDIIQRDVAFTYEILKIANTVYYYRGNRVTSVKRAALTMGLKELKKWAFITALRKTGGNNQDVIIKTSVQRAKFLELLCEKSGFGQHKTEFFTLGLLSMIDILTGCELGSLLPELPMGEQAKRVMSGSYDNGLMSVYFQLMLAYEQGRWRELQALSESLPVPLELVKEAYTEAAIWANCCDMA